MMNWYEWAAIGWAALATLEYGRLRWRHRVLKRALAASRREKGRLREELWNLKQGMTNEEPA